MKIAVFFPSDEFDTSLPDPAFAAECDAAIRAGFECGLLSHQRIVDDEVDIPRFDSTGEWPAKALYRGWMLNGAEYSRMLRTFAAVEASPWTTMDAYLEAHHLPRAYRHLAEYTVRTEWTDSHSLEEVWTLYQSFQSRGAIVKDFVKSAQHLWQTACFLPAESDRQRLSEVLTAFLEDRSHRLEGGIVLREFVPLQGLEFRLFYLRKNRLLPAAPEIPGSFLHLCDDVAGRFQSEFMTIDVAQRASGEWLIIEVGDGQVSGLKGVDPELFYSAFASTCQ